MTHRYRAFGLAIEASFPLPELLADETDGKPDLHVGTATLPPGPGSYRVEVNGPLMTIWVPDANAAYRMVEGRQLLVDPRGGEIGRNVRLYLLGSALGAILHQRELLPLHACAVEFGGKAVAFLGHSGAGKSTLAAWLAEHGGRLLSDDVCVVRQQGEGRFRAAVGIPRLRLWRDAIEARGGSVTGLPQSFEDWDKYDVSAGVDSGADQVELAGLFELAEGEQLSFTPLAGAEAVQCLAANTYRGSYVRLMGRTAKHFDQCIELARSVPVERVTRPIDYRRMETDYPRLLERVRQLTG